MTQELGRHYRLEGKRGGNVEVTVRSVAGSFSHVTQKLTMGFCALSGRNYILRASYTLMQLLEEGDK